MHSCEKFFEQIYAEQLIYLKVMFQNCLKIQSGKDWQMRKNSKSSYFGINLLISKPIVKKF